MEINIKSFLQADGIVFMDPSQTCPKYAKYPVCNIAAIFKNILQTDKQTILQVETINLVEHGQACPIYPK